MSCLGLGKCQGLPQPLGIPSVPLQLPALPGQGSARLPRQRSQREGKGFPQPCGCFESRPRNCQIIFSYSDSIGSDWATLGAPQCTRQGQLWPPRARVVLRDPGWVAGGLRWQHSLLTTFTMHTPLSLSLPCRNMGDFRRADHRRGKVAPLHAVPPQPFLGEWGGDGTSTAVAVAWVHVTHQGSPALCARARVPALSHPLHRPRSLLADGRAADDFSL